MILLVSYDISSNKLRKKVADYLIYTGLLRIQKSVFMGFVRQEIRQKIENKVNELLKNSTDTDKIIYIRVHQNSLKFANFKGDFEEEIIQEINGQLKVRIY